MQVDTSTISTTGASAVERDSRTARFHGEKHEHSERSSFSFRSNERLPALDGLRGFAILAVLVYHYAGGMVRQSSSGAMGLIAAFAGLGWTGVDLFFVLSGFLITGILYDSRGTTHYYKNFYIRRALRIFPAFYLLMAIYIVVSPFLHVHWSNAHLLFLVYLGFPAALIWPQLLLTTGPLALDHIWSLCAEEQFYFAWPGIIAKCKKNISIVYVCVALGIVAILLRIMIVCSHRLSHSWAHGFLLCRMDTLALGALLAVWARNPKYFYLRRFHTAVFAITAAGFLAICFYRHTVHQYDSLIATAGYSLAAIAFGALVAGCLDAKLWPYRIFSAGMLRLFGKYSYGIYLYHLPLTALLHPAKDMLIRQTGSVVVGGVSYLLAAIGFNLLIAYVSFRLFESPILRLKARFQS
jgi:peptidoglycan/LPS O-acetylase OafA/YrhL